MADPITFYAAIAKVQTLADGGIRIYLDLPEDAIMAAAELMAFKREEVVLDFVGTERDCKTVRNNALEEGPKRKSEWATKEMSDAHDHIGAGGEPNA